MSVIQLMFGGEPSRVMEGGTISYSGNYRIHTFTGTGTLTVPSGPAFNIDYVVVGGGGSTGLRGTLYNYISGCDWQGGGGAGGLLHGSTSLSSGSYAISIGAGAPTGDTQYGNGYNGGQTTAFGLTAFGGGAGAQIASQGQFGGSGGGGSGNNAGGGGYQGNNGGVGFYFPGNAQYPPWYNGGGGGGYSSAGAAGPNVLGCYPAAGGSGYYSSITGQIYSQGGAGGSINSGYPNTGNGGHGGGSGIVVIRYLI